MRKNIIQYYNRTGVKVQSLMTVRKTWRAGAAALALLVPGVALIGFPGLPAGYLFILPGLLRRAPRQPRGAVRCKARRRGR